MKKRHHYIPKFYLEKFIDPLNRPYIWIYEKGNPNIKKATATDIAVEKDYYTFTSIDGKRDSNSYEDKLAEIEGYAAPVFQKITSRKNLSDEDRIDFASFLAFVMIRVPHFRDKVKRLAEVITKDEVQTLAGNPEAFESSIRELGLQEKIENQEELRQSLLEENWDIKVSPQFSLDVMRKVAIDLLAIFYKMNWCFLLATESHKFVASDNPVYYFNPLLNTRPYYIRGFFRGLMNKYAEISFPISKDILFLGTWCRNECYRELKIKHIKQMNTRTILSASRFVFASKYSASFNEIVQKYRNVSAL